MIERLKRFFGRGSYPLSPGLAKISASLNALEIAAEKWRQDMSVKITRRYFKISPIKISDLKENDLVLELQVHEPLGPPLKFPGSEGDNNYKIGMCRVLSDPGEEKVKTKELNHFMQWFDELNVDYYERSKSNG